MTADLEILAERQRTGGFVSTMPVSRRDQIAQVLVRNEGAKTEHSALVADLILDRVRWPENGGAAAVLTRTGDPDPGATVAGLIGEMRAVHPWAFAGGPLPSTAAALAQVPGSSRFAPGTLTARAIADHAARKADAKAEADGSNPFAPATRNLTRAALVERDDPARAARLKAEAGVR